MIYFRCWPSFIGTKNKVQGSRDASIWVSPFSPARLKDEKTFRVTSRRPLWKRLISTCAEAFDDIRIYKTKKKIMTPHFVTRQQCVLLNSESGLAPLTGKPSTWRPAVLPSTQPPLCFTLHLPLLHYQVFCFQHHPVRFVSYCEKACSFFLNWKLPWNCDWLEHVTFFDISSLISHRQHSPIFLPSFLQGKANADIFKLLRNDTVLEFYLDQMSNWYINFFCTFPTYVGVWSWRVGGWDRISLYSPHSYRSRSLLLKNTKHWNFSVLSSFWG